MAKKVTSFVLLFLCISMLSGCEKVKDLTDEETRLIAEYAATSLLKYDLNYADRIAEGEREAHEKAETEDAVTKEETTDPEEATTKEVITEEDSKRPPVEDMIDGKTTENIVEKEEVQDLAPVLNEEGLSIKYSDYLISKQYPSKDKNGELIYLNASDGYELLVLQFQVKNITDEKVETSFLDKDVDYKILCNGNKAANPMLTILLDDLTTIDVSLNPSDETEAVLVFQVSESMKDNIQTMELNVHYNDTDSKINILR